MFAGRIYARPAAGGARGVLARLPDPLPLPDNDAGGAEQGWATTWAAGFGAVAAALLVLELAPRLSRRGGIAKVSGASELTEGGKAPSNARKASQARAAARKANAEAGGASGASSAAAAQSFARREVDDLLADSGEGPVGRKAELAGQLKSLSAVMSAERAQRSGTAAGAPAAAAAAPAPAAHIHAHATAHDAEGRGAGSATTLADSTRAALARELSALAAVLGELMGSEALQYSYQLIKALKEQQTTCGALLGSLSGVGSALVQSASAAAQLDTLARLGRETAAAAEAAERRRPLAGNAHGLLCAAHESLLRLNELSLEAVSVPLLASQLRSALRQSLVDLATATAAPAREARRRQLEAADVNVVDALRSAPSPVLLARLAATAFDVNVTEHVERERETGRAEGEGEGERMLQAAVSELSDTADRLVATRSVLHIAVAVREAAALMEGHVLAEEGRALRRAVAQLIPDADAAASPGASSLPGSPASRIARGSATAAGVVSATSTTCEAEEGRAVKAALMVRLLVRREQLRLAGAHVAGEEHDDAPGTRALDAAWRHLVNAAEELQALVVAPQRKQQQRFRRRALARAAAAGAIARRLFSTLRALKERRATLALRRDEQLSFDNLIMETHLGYRKRALADTASLKLLRALLAAASPAEANKGGPALLERGARALHRRVRHAVEQVLPGALVGLSIGASAGGSVVASLAHAGQDDDVVVCFVVGTGDRPCTQLTFVRATIAPQAQAALFDVLQALTLGGLLDVPAAPAPAPAAADLVRLQTVDTIIEQLVGLAGAKDNSPFALCAELPAGWAMRDGEPLDAAAARLAPHGDSALAGATICCDTQSLRSPAAQIALHPGAGPAVLFLLLPAGLALLSQSHDAAEQFAQAIAHTHPQTQTQRQPHS